MCVVLEPNIGISTSISNTTQICPQHIRNFVCLLEMFAGVRARVRVRISFRVILR